MNESQSTEFWCKPGGSPQPKIIWQKHGQDLGECSLRWGAVNCRTFSERHKVSFSKGTSFLRVVNTLFHKDDGQYSCIVKNTVGEENVTLHLTVQGIVIDNFAQHSIFYITNRAFAEKMQFDSKRERSLFDSFAESNLTIKISQI